MAIYTFRSTASFRGWCRIAAGPELIQLLDSLFTKTLRTSSSSTYIITTRIMSQYTSVRLAMLRMINSFLRLSMSGIMGPRRTHGRRRITHWKFTRSRIWRLRIRMAIPICGIWMASIPVHSKDLITGRRQQDGLQLGPQEAWPIFGLCPIMCNNFCSFCWTIHGPSGYGGHID